MEKVKRGNRMSMGAKEKMEVLRDSIIVVLPYFSSVFL